VKSNNSPSGTVGSSEHPSVSDYGSAAPPPVSVAVQAHTHDVGNLTLGRQVSVGNTTLNPSMTNLQIAWMDQRMGHS